MRVEGFGVVWAVRNLEVSLTGPGSYHTWTAAHRLIIENGKYSIPASLFFALLLTPPVKHLLTPRRPLVTVCVFKANRSRSTPSPPNQQSEISVGFSALCFLNHFNSWTSSFCPSLSSLLLSHFIVLQLLRLEALRPFSALRTEEDQLLSGTSVARSIYFLVCIFLWANLDVLHCVGTDVVSLEDRAVLSIRRLNVLRRRYRKKLQRQID